MQGAEKKIKIFYVGPLRYSYLSVLELHGQARINLKFFLGCNIKFQMSSMFSHQKGLKSVIFLS